MFGYPAKISIAGYFMTSYSKRAQENANELTR
jgi:hypothetical protein